MHNRFRADQITKFALKKKRHASQHNPTHQGNDREREKKLKCMRNACELEHSAIACDCMRTETHGNCMRLHANWNTRQLHATAPKASNVTTVKRTKGSGQKRDGVSLQGREL